MRFGVHRVGAIAVAIGVAAAPSPAAAVDPVPSQIYLPTGNGFGFQVFDTNRQRITDFLERPYRYLRPNPQFPDGDGVVRRNLAWDAYLGVGTPVGNAWLAEASQEEVGYVDQTNVIRSMTHVDDVKVESFFFAPFGLEQNGMVAILTATNEGDAAVDLEAFALANFHMGTADQPDFPGTNGESIEFTPDPAAARETGPGGGTMLYVPIGEVTHSSCATDAYATVGAGDELEDEHQCSGDDRVNVFEASLGSVGPGESASWGVAMLFAPEDMDATLSAWTAFQDGRDAATVLSDALAEWDDWRTPVPPLGGDEERVWRQSEAVLRMGQILEPYGDGLKNHGMILASLPPGGWHTGWVRDAMYAIAALSRMGHGAEAKRALDFFLDADAGKYPDFLNGVDYRISVVRYFGNGEEEADYSGSPTRNVEIDGWGMYLWAARTYLDATGDTAWLSEDTARGDTVYDAIREGVAEALASNLEETGMAIADASIWEVHWGNRQHFFYTTAAAARGFCDMAAIARRLERSEDVDRYAGLSESAVEAIRTLFVDRNHALAGSLEQLATGANYHDGATVESVTWNLLPPDDPIATATMNDFTFLQTPAGGYKRLEGSNSAYDIDEWILLDLRVSDAFRRLGRDDQADQLLEWVTGQASVNYDLLPELYNTRTTIGEYNGSIPMVGYGAGAYVLTMLDRQGLFEHSDCGSEEPVVPPDGGVPDFGDLDASTGGQEGDGGTGVLPRTGTACLCTAPGARANNAGWLLVIIAVVGTRYRRAIRRHRTRSRSCRTNTAEIPSARVDPGEFGSVGPTHPESIVIGTACEGVACP